MMSLSIGFFVCLRDNRRKLLDRSKFVDQGRVVRKPVNVNPGLNFNWSITISYLKMFFTCDIWCSLRLLQIKTEEQAI